MKPRKQKECSKHGLTDFALWGKKRERWGCIICSNLKKQNPDYKRPSKIKRDGLIKNKGGKCAICNYDKNFSALHFHHINRKDKIFNITQKNIDIYPWEDVLKEAEKCAIICARCHQGVETGQIEFLNQKNNIHQIYSRTKSSTLSYIPCSIHKTNNKQCKQCISYNMYHHKIRKYSNLLKCHGNKCCSCGFNDFISGFQFHHTNPKTKEFSIGAKRNSYGFEELLKESKKCVLLCANCHVEVETKSTDLPSDLVTSYSYYKHLEIDKTLNLNNIDFLCSLLIFFKTKKAVSEFLKISLGTIKNRYKRYDLDLKAAYNHFGLKAPDKISVKKINCNLTNTCADCKTPVKQRADRCLECFKKHKKQKALQNRPDYIQLKEDIEQGNYSSVGRKYGVADNTIRKWMREYEAKLEKSDIV